MILTKDGTTINVTGNTITTSKGEIFHLSGQNLIGPTGIVARKATSMDYAVGVVIGLHGGRQM